MNILVVDDSIVFRMAISQALKEVDGINVSDTASNGKVAVDILKKNDSIDLVTLDLEMPIMDGLSAIEEIRKFNTTIPIIVFSGHTQVGAEKTMLALNKGASDFVTKQDSSGRTLNSSLDMIRELLVPKIKVLVESSEIQNTKDLVSSRKKIRSSDEEGKRKDDSKISRAEKFVSDMNIRPKLVMIGCSTGGPDALCKIFSSISVKANVPMLIVQHMPPLFTQKLATMLDNLCSHIEVREAVDGDEVKPGLCLIAPGDYHMVYNKDGRISLNQREKVCFVRPAVNVLFDSVIRIFDDQVFAAILTGMGEDGADSMKKLKNMGAYLAIQDEESSSVWGMPGAVNRDLPDVEQFNINEFGPILNNIFGRL